ncbi:MAG: hypothetical protein JWP44_4839 [Mucilaginibacter sp.]|nr:hypothetical protein [Mucilaginibacter sp.]
MSNSLDLALALDAYQKAQPEVRTLILAEAEKLVQTNIGRVDALNQRLSALCALLFAGAAVAATLTTNADKLPPLAIYIACGSSVAFALGGAIGCCGLFSRRSVFPGEKPSWWASHGVDALAQLTEDGAKGWLIERSEEMIDSLAKAVKRRALTFNIAVVAGAIAGALIAGAALAGAIIGPPVKDEPLRVATPNINFSY